MKKKNICFVIAILCTATVIGRNVTATNNMGITLNINMPKTCEWFDDDEEEDYFNDNVVLDDNEDVKNLHKAILIGGSDEVASLLLNMEGEKVEFLNQEYTIAERCDNTFINHLSVTFLDMSIERIYDRSYNQENLSIVEFLITNGANPLKVTRWHDGRNVNSFFKLLKSTMDTVSNNDDNPAILSILSKSQERFIEISDIFLKSPYIGEDSRYVFNAADSNGKTMLDLAGRFSLNLEDGTTIGLPRVIEYIQQHQ